MTPLTEYDLHLMAEGTHYRSYEKMGAHISEFGGKRGVQFRVWAPNAEEVSVIGDFNAWMVGRTSMQQAGHSGIWECFVPSLDTGALYKYHIKSRIQGYSVDKADPFGFAAEIRPRTASKVWDLHRYQWSDQQWMHDRQVRNLHTSPMSIYEMHLGSWMRVPEDDNRWLTYREMAPKLADYLQHMGFTHVEFLPITEHPFDGSWGYQTIGYFAPTSRFGNPDDFRSLIDTLHQRGIGVILDWAPAHFPHDEHGLAFFDGTNVYEHSDPRQGLHPDWDTAVFNYGRHEVRNFLISNAMFWFEQYHIDALRVDAVASMLYLDYGRKMGEWIPNYFGGRENLEAVGFLRALNEQVHGAFPGTTVIAEESTSWPMVSKPTYMGGLGFGFKWNMGWMHDMLSYMSKDPVHRSYHHNLITFSLLYAFTENFVLPFSHDEVVHGKGSMIAKMSGDYWQKFANLRLLYGFMFGHPGKKMLFMGNEFGQWNEWNHDISLDWHLLQYPIHSGLQRWVRDLNTFYRSDPALFEKEFEHDGFEWIDCDDYQNSIVSFLRRGSDHNCPTLFVCNFTPVPRYDYRLGVPKAGYWKEELNSDATLYGGSGLGNGGGVTASSIPCHGRPYSVSLTLPPLSVVIFRT
ncbi:MAG: 1,4-alpha-glucan branching enzyme [Acidobacteria bacterium RIFCSPLOWO2_12_FULL_54_10]|nr:MAG: 1,4-alpha-glucan branching enzyme [Acidobacteria bacterium RIFCSPLOWO2_12_FULL_54_10]